MRPKGAVAGSDIALWQVAFPNRALIPSQLLKVFLQKQQNGSGVN